jgi:tetratricopeptide (TPR) repeat protein
LAAYLFWPRPAPLPPAVDLQGVEAAVATAIADAQESVRASPRSAEAWGRLGMVLLAHQFREEARLCFVEAERLDSSNARWPYFQALVLVREDIEATISKLQDAIKLCGDEPDAPRLKLAETLLLQGRAAEAAAHYRQVLRRQPAHPAAHLGLARLALEDGDLQSGLEHADFAAGSPLTRKAAHSLRATLLQRLGQPSAALQETHRIARWQDDPPWPDPYYAEVTQLAVDRGSRVTRAIQLLNQNRLPEALTILHDLIAANPDWDLAWRFLGDVLLEQRHYADAERALLRSVALAPGSAEAHVELARALLAQGKQQAALTEFHKAGELRPANAMLQYNIGHSLASNGDRANAVTAFEAALRFDPDLAVAHRDLGNLLAGNGELQRAQVHLRRAAELSPDDDTVKQLNETIKSSSPAPQEKR